MIEALLFSSALVAMVLLLLAENRSSKNSGDKNIGLFGYRDLTGKVSKKIKTKSGKSDA